MPSTHNCTTINSSRSCEIPLRHRTRNLGTVSGVFSPSRTTGRFIGRDNSQRSAFKKKSRLVRLEEALAMTFLHYPKLSLPTFSRWSGFTNSLLTNSCTRFLTPYDLLRKVSMILPRPNFASELRNVSKNILSAPVESVCHE
jgi:hypothetical protein